MSTEKTRVIRLAKDLGIRLLLGAVLSLAYGYFRVFVLHDADVHAVSKTCGLVFLGVTLGSLIVRPPAYLAHYWEHDDE